jgi:fumarate reductase flavoprotein subunit
MQRALMPFRRPAGDINSIRNRLMDTMWDDVGVLREHGRLQNGLAKLGELNAELLDTGLDHSSRGFNLSWHDWLNLQSLIEVSQVITSAALSRENSRGAHFREDFTDVGSLQDSYFTVATAGDGKITVSREAVEFSIVKPGESLIDD